MGGGGGAATLAVPCGADRPDKADSGSDGGGGGGGSTLALQ